MYDANLINIFRKQLVGQIILHKSLGTYIWNGFSETWGPWGLIFSIALGFVFWIFSPDTTIGLYWVIPLCFVSMLMIFVFIRSLFNCLEDLERCLEDNKIVLPRVVYGRGPENYRRDYCAIIVLESSPLFSHGCLVSIYSVIDDYFETLVGMGRVLNIQEDKLIQVGIIDMGTDEELIDKIKQNNADRLKKLIVKPSVEQQVYQLTLGEADAQ